MTAVAPAAAPAGPAGRISSSSVGRTAWGTARTVLRLHRTALLVWAAVVLALSGWLVWLTAVAVQEEVAAWEACERAGQDLCDMTVGWVGYSESLGWVGLLISSCFLGVAAFAGGALIGRELENGTARLAWAQGITPARWLAAKLAVPALALTAGVTVLVLVYRWAWGANRFLTYNGWMGDDAYLSRGPAGLAYVLCALAVGVLTALLLRRALPALAVSVAATGLLAFVVAQYRGSFWPAVTRTSTAGTVDYPDNAWELENGVLIHGRRTPDIGYWTCDGTAAEARRCLDDLGITGSYTTYHPESHYWPIQLVETGVVLTVAALAVAAAFLLLRHRTARPCPA
ncbi:hypothetical protein [Streptomyces rishiriensis]|uniref:ABC transporter permease n=1 Tax=Streptomyces rishiriensis TaxID=68264 RepID=A0ABU0NS42_STRRH|nr:hypothetical protein [Streptomyces rishiriensis]MDQ0581919.1 hypothetical protein [Streptomyces rishiriensis]